MCEGEGRRPTILVVDDKDDHREIIVAALEGCGYRICEAGDAESALEAARREKPDLVFLDLQLTGSDIDGVQLLQVLKREQPELRVAAYTAWAIPEWRERAEAAGCDEYLVKPTELAEVRRIAAKFLRPPPRPPQPAESEEADRAQSGPSVATDPEDAQPL